MAYQTLYTASGLASIAAAIASGTPINLTQMAVGDGGGSPVTLSSTPTGLVRELFRATVNRVYQDPTNATLFTAELVIPATTGGFVLREVGVLDSNGNWFAVGNLPDTYKPTSSEGAFSDAIVRVQFVVSNASIITLQIDPNVAVATQSWVSNNITAAELLPGGTTHQVLRKKTNTDGDTEWVDPTDANVVVDMIEETQTLAAAQTAVILTTVTSDGLAIYIEGVRLKKADWTAVDATHITLAQSYPAGTIATLVQNEPAGSIVYPLAQSLNLSDVPNKATARTNLGVPSVADLTNAVPPGIIDHFAGTAPPTGWLSRNGAAISRTAYAALFAVLGTRFGVGDGFNTFNLPDDRGLFDRGFDGGRGLDPSRVFGSQQADDIISHTHPNNWRMADENGSQNDRMASGGSTLESAYFTLATGATGGTETRPKNRAYLPIIKY
jgi:phage-related tail fiber protein